MGDLLPAAECAVAESRGEVDGQELGYENVERQRVEKGGGAEAPCYGVED